MRPGRTVFDERLDGDGSTTIAHQGKTYSADPEGWFDVPPEVGAYFCAFPGWRTPEQIDEEVVAGRIKVNEADKLPVPVVAKPRGRVKSAA